MFLGRTLYDELEGNNHTSVSRNAFYAAFGNQFNVTSLAGSIYKHRRKVAPGDDNMVTK